MADEKVETRDVNFRQLLPWTELFRGFQVALDPKKLLLAAAGIVLMALGWRLLSYVFYTNRERPDFASGHWQDSQWNDFKEARRKWWVLHEAAGDKPVATDANDAANSPEEFRRLHDEGVAGQSPSPATVKPWGRMRTWPWDEDRGPNPYLLVTGQESTTVPEAAGAHTPWQRGQFLNWLLTDQLPVLIEPIVKFLLPVIFLLKFNIGFWNGLYFALVLLWTLATWALFGGAITRMAAVQLARKEKLGMAEAVRFTVARYLSFFSAPLFPLVFVLVLAVCLIVFGAVQMIPILGELVDGLLWPLVLLAGLVMAVILVGLAGWPMMYATISAEGSDSFDALSRSYSYEYQCPWHYLWYCAVALAYGAVVVFFVGFMGSLTVYLGKWGVSQTPWIHKADRDPSYLFVFAPTSWQWQELLLQGATVDGKPVVHNGVVDRAAYDQYLGSFHWWNYIGAALVSVWVYLVFLMVIGFAYSYFWSESTIIYLLMRRKVDDTELDEVYLEGDETEEPYSASAPVASTPSPGPSGTTPLTVLEQSPALKTPAPAAPAALPPDTVESAAPERTDRNPPV